MAELDNHTGGIALVAGYGLFVGTLVWTQSGSLGTATGSLRELVFFVIFPALGVASGGYSYFGLPLHAGAVLVSGTYLAALGVALSLLSTGSTPLTLAGVGLFVLAVVAIVGSLRAAVIHPDVI